MNIIKNEEKFAAISFWECGAKIEIPAGFHLGKGLFASHIIPFEVTPWWREQLGTIQSDEIEKSEFFLIATINSNDPKVLNSENDRIVDKCRNLFYAFLLSGFTCVTTEPILVTGSSEKGVATFRSISNFEFPRCIMGTRPTDIDLSRLSDVYRIYNGLITAIYEKKIKGRVVWAMNCFLNGTRSSHIHEKIRNFVRVIEAFILPDVGKTTKQFKSRTEIFIGAGKHELINKIYEVRSAIEHLHDPLIILCGKNNKEKFTSLLQLGITVEYMARCCIVRFLKNKELWDHFSTDEDIGKFWLLEGEEKQKIWGEYIDPQKANENFDVKRVTYTEDPI